MIRMVLTLLLMLSFLEASSERYFIKFGSFKNIRGLEKSIDRLPDSLRSHVVIVRSNSWYVPFAYYTSSAKPLYAKVAGYRYYFPDAQIAHSSNMLLNPLVRNYSQSTIHQEPYVPPVKQVYYQPKRVIESYQKSIKVG